MKKTLVLSAALMTLVGLSSFAEERTLIDFTTLKADIAVYPQDYDGEKKENQNKRTIMDYATAAGASFSAE